MDKTSLIGIILAFIALSVGMVLKGVSLTALINPAAILIIVVGTISAVVIAFPSSEIKKTPKLFGKIFKDNKLPTIQEMIPLFSNWAQIARREGLLALEASLEEVDDDFLKNGLSMAVDGQSAEFIRDVLTEEVDAMSERHQSGSLIFTQEVVHTLRRLVYLAPLSDLLPHLQTWEILKHLDMQSVRPSLPRCLGFLPGMCYGIHLRTS